MYNEYSIGPLTGQLKPKYKVIQMALGLNFSPSTYGVDVYIDLNSLLSTMASSRKFMNSLPFSTNAQSDIVYCLLQTFVHWKNFTRRWNSVRIFMMVNDFNFESLCEQSVLRSYMSPFKHKFSNDNMQQLTYYWNESIKLTQTVLQYIPRGYLIKCDQFDSFVLPQILSDHKHDKIIMTADPFMTSHFYMPNTKVIYSRFVSGGMSQISDPQMLVHAVSKIDDELVTTFIDNKVFYNTLQLMIGSKDRAIQGIQPLGLTAFASDLIRAVEQRKIPSNPKAIDSVLSIINPSYHDYIKKNYPLVDVESHTKLITPSAIESIKSQVIDKLDIDGLSKLSIEGMNLMELM